MNRTQKIQEVEKLKAGFSGAQLTILTDFKGLKVAEFNELRRRLEAKKSGIKVVKNRLAKIAVKGTPEEVLLPFFSGTTAMATTTADPAGPAKVLTEFAKEHEAVQIKAAVMNGKAVSRAEIIALAALPSREELIVKMMGSMTAPAKNLVLVLAQLPRKLVNVLASVRDQKQKTGETKSTA